MKTITLSLLFSLCCISNFSLFAASEVSEDQINFSTNDGVKLKGNLYSPKNNSKKLPAILFIEGSGKTSLLETPESDPVKFLMREFAKNGFVALSFNKRGSGENLNNGSFYKSTYRTHVEDSLSAYEFLKAQEGTDPSQIYLLGHSLGGTIATELSFTVPTKGLILYAAPTRKMEEVVSEQSKFVFKYSGKTEEEASLALERVELAISQMKTDTFACKAFQEFCVEEEGEEVFQGYPVKYYQEILNLDQIENLKKVKVPTLILHGTTDFVVSIKDANLASETLDSVEVIDLQVNILPKLDHLFARNGTKEESFKYMTTILNTKEFKPVHEGFLKSVLSWFKEHK